MVLLRGFDPGLFHRRSIRLKGYDYSRPGIYFFTICVNPRESLFGAFSDGIVLLSPYGEIVKSTWFDLPNHNLNITLDTFVIIPDHFHGIIIINETSAVGEQGGHDTDNGDAGDDVGPGSEQNVGAGSGCGAVNDLGPGSEQNVGPGSEQNVGAGSGQNVGAGSEPAPTFSTNDPSGTFSTNDPAGTFCTNDRTDPICTNNPASHIAPFRRAPVPKQQPLSEIIRQFKTFSARRINEMRKTPGVSVWQRNYYESIIRGKDNLDKVRKYILANPQRIKKQVDDK